MFLDHIVSSGEVPYLPVLYVFLTISFIYFLFFHEWELYTGIPEVKMDGDGGMKLYKAKPDIYLHGKEIVERGLKQFRTVQGPRVILPNRFADEVRNNPHLDFNNAIASDFFLTYPGFEPFYDEGDLTATVSLRQRTCCHFLFVSLVVFLTEDANIIAKEWTEVALKPKLLDLISRISARVFIGQELCNNKEWLEITKRYTIDSFVAAQTLRSWPAFTRPFVHWFLPECRKIRQEMSDARRIIQPVLDERRERNRKAREAGKPPAKVADAVGWMDDVANSYDYDAAAAQIGLSLAAIHTTTMSLCGIFYDLMTHPDYIECLRNEVRAVLGQDGWKKTSLYQLRLMDSLMKESQRHHLPDFVSMQRIVESPVKLSDGTVIPKGARMAVTNEKLRDPTIFPDPYGFQGKRYLDMRQQPGSENRWQFVTTSPEHLTFGHGKHACPGRFFASNEVKVALSHLLMMYDWKMAEDDDGTPHIEDFDINPEATIMMRKRQENMPCFNL
ncbi:cytochrome P450 [Colletotrichum tofieldiae]|uniref:Cytochrome P450 n=1 Tax=Colletotrichum tofieldiae TaxID=708197 RepID=A0A166XMM9_9PEZI|nr:cytochrome P450 [Colletotrichum tofieldiae]